MSQTSTGGSGGVTSAKMNAKMKTGSSPSSSNADEKKDPENYEIVESETNHEKDKETSNKKTDSTKSEVSREKSSVEPESKTEVTTESESSSEAQAEGDIVKEKSKKIGKKPEEADKKEEEEKDEEEDEEENKSSASKLEADALSASLSSSRCLLKRNRGDLDTDSDNDDKQEEPDSKKSHTAGGKEEEEEDGETEEGKEDGGSLQERATSTSAPVVVSKSKLSSSELVASMSSSKSVLKRGIEQVEVASSRDYEEAPEPEVKVKKSLTSGSPPVPLESSTRKKLVEEAKEKDNSHDVDKARERLIYNVKSSVISPLKSECPLMESTRLNSPESCKSKSISEGNPMRATPTKSLLSPKEPVRIIAAKDLEEDRKLERKRLNKMLLIFPDQKPV